MKRNYKKSIAALLLVVLTLVSVLLTGCKSASSTRVHDYTAKKLWRQSTTMILRPLQDSSSAVKLRVKH